jgi:hypothetical protein
MENKTLIDIHIADVSIWQANDIPYPTTITCKEGFKDLKQIGYFFPPSCWILFAQCWGPLCMSTNGLFVMQTSFD